MSNVGKSVELLITGYSHDGQGVGRLQEQVVFVPGTIKGEQVKVTIKKEQKGIMTGQLEEIIEPAKQRITPACQVFSACGGCQLQHLAYPAQLQLKKGIVEDGLRRIGGFKDLVVQPVLGMAEPWGYRNKGHFRVEQMAGAISLGFYEEGTHSQVKQSCRHLFSKEVVELLDGLAELLDQFKVPVATADTPGLRHLMLRESRSKGEIMLVFIISAELAYDFRGIAREICNKYSKVVGVCININPRRAGPILGKKTKVIIGRGEIEDNIGPFTFTISPYSFFQVNNVQTAVLYAKVVEFAGLTGRELVVDAYCGIGAISLFLAQQAKRVIGVELVPAAIYDAMKNAERNKVSNVEFIQGEAERVMPNLVKKGLKPQVVVVDPPRKGCEQLLLDSILQVKPERVVYVSCNPATLARDLKYLVAGGYEVKEVQPVDMFPQTGHTETCCLLERI